MTSCAPYLESRRLYRGQAHKYEGLVASSWRKRWLARRAFHDALAALAETYIGGSESAGAFSARLAELLRSATADAGVREAPSYYQFLAEPGNAALLVNLLTHIRDSIGSRFRVDVCRIQMEQLEQSFHLRLHRYFFNEVGDPFFRRSLPNTLRSLAAVALEFYDDQRSAFDVEYRIAQVSTDLMGVLQHYGVLGTPGIDLTDEIDVALWFATHDYNSAEKRYERLPPGQWGVVYEFDVPVITFSPKALAGKMPVDALPSVRVVCLHTLSDRFERIKHQRGWYAVNHDGWSSLVDFTQIFQVRVTRVLDGWNAADIGRRMDDLTEVDLFPPADKDPFKAHLARFQIGTFL